MVLYSVPKTKESFKIVTTKSLLMKGQKFLGLAACFQKLRSTEDHDIKMTKSNEQPTDKSAKKYRQHRPPRGYPFRPGLCFQFQGSAGCQKENCGYSHISAVCRSEKHGKSQCPK